VTSRTTAAPDIGQTDPTSALLRKKLLAGLDPHATKVEAIGVPAGLDGHVRTDLAAAVTTVRDT
jgi:hypothetical protein